MGYFAQLPAEVEWAARMDGYGRFATLRRVLIPMALPGIAVVAILSFLMAWNEFFFAKARIFCGCYLGNTIYPNWHYLYDLRQPPEEIVSIMNNREELKKRVETTNPETDYSTLKSFAKFATLRMFLICGRQFTIRISA